MNNSPTTKSLLIIFICFFTSIFISAKPISKGYEIALKNLQVTNTKLYLVGNYGEIKTTIDSTIFIKKLKKEIIIKNVKENLPSGFYTIQSKEGKIIIDFLIDQTRNFTIDFLLGYPIFDKSEENVIYQQFKKDLAAEKPLFMYYQTSPESLLAKFILAQYIPVSIPEFHWGSHEGQAGAAQQYYRYLIAHYFDNVDFQDERLMRTPLNVDLSEFFSKSLYPQTAENVIARIEDLENRIIYDKIPTKEQCNIRDFYIKKLVHLYISCDSKFDEVFIYIIDKYVATLQNSLFFSEAEISVYKRVADRKRKTLVGETVPVFEAYDINRQKISSNQFSSEYLILWFWDPDCEHCVEETPKLCDFYAKYKGLYDFEVFACSVTEDYDRWVKYLKEHHTDWFNASYAIENPNYDAVEYFNFNDTPAIFVIDKQHKIVARQFPIDDLIEVFERIDNREK